MWQRIQTALILVIIVGVAMFASKAPYLFLALLAVGVIKSASEWTKLLPKTANNAGKSVINPTVFVVITFVVTMASLFTPVSWHYWWAASVIVWVLAMVWVGQYPKKTNWFDSRLIVIGVVLMTAAMTAMFYLWQQSPWWLMYVFVLVWCADSGAYFVGRKFGKRKMAPSVSPNKSMEGLYGGLATGLIAVLAVSFGVLHYSGPLLILFVLLSAVTIVSSVLGDLFESMLKRQAGIKDSGTILPGHGGVLDRIDSLLAATPIFALGHWLMMSYMG